MPEEMSKKFVNQGCDFSVYRYTEPVYGRYFNNNNNSIYFTINIIVLHYIMLYYILIMIKKSAFSFFTGQ